MNLAKDPWIPVIMQDGTCKDVSLIDAFTHGAEIHDLSLNPVQRISVMRLLICVAQAALDGPDDEEDWLACRDRIPGAAKDYLEGLYDRFELYGSHAFLQVPDLEGTSNEFADKLEFGTAVAQGSTLFDQFAPQDGRLHASSWFPIQLLTYQCFSPGGTIGVSMWNGVSTKDKLTQTALKGPGYSSDSPCLGGSILHAIIRGDDLLASIWWNLLSKEQIATLPNGEWGVPLWESFPASCADSSIKALSRSYLWRLVPLARAIQIQPNSPKITLVDGCGFPALPESREPTASVITVRRGEKETLRYECYRPGQHVWRQLAAVLTLDRMGSPGGPLCLQHVLTETGVTFDLWIGGIARRPGQNKLLDMAEWTFHVPTGLLNSTELHVYEQGVAMAQKGASVLGSAVSSYRKELKGDGAGLKQKAEARFWAHLDVESGNLLRTAVDLCTHLNDTWYPVVRTALQGAYKRTCPHTTPRQIQAFAQGLMKLRLKKLQEDNEPDG
jgi:CRISPR system Cascade subunit CasA